MAALPADAICRISEGESVPIPTLPRLSIIIRSTPAVSNLILSSSLSPSSTCILVSPSASLIPLAVAHLVFPKPSVTSACPSEPLEPGSPKVTFPLKSA